MPDPAKVQALVQVQVGMLETWPVGVPDSMTASEADHPAGGARTRFDSWTGYLLYGLRVCRIARQTSILQDGVRFLGRLLNYNTSSECAGTHATLRRSQTRFDSWRGH